MSTYPDHILRMGSQHLAELKRKAAEFERQLWDAHESLTAFNPELKIVPSLAESWENPDEKTWLFRLRPDARFLVAAPRSCRLRPVSADRAVDAERRIVPRFPGSCTPAMANKGPALDLATTSSRENSFQCANAATPSRTAETR